MGGFSYNPVITDEWGGDSQSQGRKRLLAAMTGSDTDDSERQFDAGAMPRTSESPRLIDRIEDDKTRHPQGDALNAGESLKNYGSPDETYQPWTPQQQSQDRIARMQDQYDRMGQTPPAQPMSLKQKLLRGALLAAPVALGALANGAQGAAAAAAGEGQGYLSARNRAQDRQDRLNAQNQGARAKLLDQILAEQRMQEQESLADKRFTLTQKLEDQRERERQASQERLFAQQGTLEGQREAARDKTLKEQIDEQNKRQSAQFAEQEKLQGIRDAAADRRQAASDARRDKAQDTKWQQVASKRYETAMDADQRLSRMEASYKEGLKGDQQAQLALLMDHIGMTLGLQKGARITKDVIQEAQQSAPALGRIEAHFDSNGYLTGAVLTPDQMRQMLQLGYGARDRAVQGAYDDSQLYGVAPPPGAQTVFNKRKTGEMPALRPGGTSQPGADPLNILH